MYNICLICSSLTLTTRLKPALLTTTKFGQFNGENDDHITSARASVYYRVTFFEDLFFLSLKRKTPEKKHFSHSKKKIDFSFVFPPEQISSRLMDSLVLLKPDGATVASVASAKELPTAVT